METSHAIAVVGVCEPERTRYATKLANRLEATLILSGRLSEHADPIRTAQHVLRSPAFCGRVVLELPSATEPIELIGSLTDHPEFRLTGIVCVVDAMHFFDDLMRDEAYFRSAGSPGGAVYRARVTLEQVEYASRIVIVNWEGFGTERIAMLMALLNHLSPHARLRLLLPEHEPVGAGTEYRREQERAGWISILNEEFDPYMSHERITSFRYEQVRPLHPGRLWNLLQHGIGTGAFGNVVRSGGFCTLATRSSIIAGWDQVGRLIEFPPRADMGNDDEILALGQDIAFTGIDLDRSALSAALDSVALNDAEFSAGPSAWARMPDPLPVWDSATDVHE